MIYYGYSINSGADNMRIDSEILDRAIEQKSKEPVFRLYGWSPKCISLGRNQKDTFLTGEIDSVRRLTGGRAVSYTHLDVYKRQVITKASPGPTTGIISSTALSTPSRSA